MSDTVGAHNDLHSEQGARPGEHPGRSRNPVIKVHDIAWLEFEKSDLVRAEAFALAFGFSTVSRTPDELHLRGTDAGAPCVILRRGARSRFVGVAFKAARRSRRASAGRGDGRTDARRYPNLSAVWPWISSTRPAFPSMSWREHMTFAIRLRNRSTPSISVTSYGGRTGHSGPRACQPRCSGSGTSCCRPPSTSRHSIGISRALGDVGVIVPVSVGPLRAQRAPMTDLPNRSIVSRTWARLSPGNPTCTHVTPTP